MSEAPPQLDAPADESQEEFIETLEPLADVAQAAIAQRREIDLQIATLEAESRLPRAAVFAFAVASLGGAFVFVAVSILVGFFTGILGNALDAIAARGSFSFEDVPPYMLLIFAVLHSVIPAFAAAISFHATNRTYMPERYVARKKIRQLKQQLVGQRS